MEFDLKPIAPFDLGLTVWALRRRSHNVVDQWDGVHYRRVVALNGRASLMIVVQTGSIRAPRLRVTLPGTRASAAREKAVTGIVERTLGLRSDLRPFYQLAAKDRRLAPLAQRFLGLKPPRFPTLFEALVNGIACQQITLEAGLTLLNRLAQNFGSTIGEQHAFPRPDDLAGTEAEQLRALGFSGQKARAIVELSGAMASGWDLNAIEELDDDEAKAQLLQLRGVGRWTAEYVMLRGLGRVHIFPGDDVGARKRLAAWLGSSKLFDYATVNRAVAPWQPYAGLIYFHLLLRGLEQKGQLEPPR